MNKLAEIPLVLAFFLLISLSVSAYAEGNIVSLNDSRITDSFGTALSEINQFQHFQIVADVINMQNISQDVVFFVTVTDDEGQTTKPKWISMSLNPDQKFSSSISWSPKNTGIHTINIQILDDLQTKKVLNTLEFFVDVSESKTNINESRMSVMKQILNGVAIEDIVCKSGYLLVLRTNGSPACVSERTIERTGWEILKTEFIYTENTIPEPTITPEQVAPTIIILDHSSDVEFVDDGRDIFRSKLKGSAPPRNYYNSIMTSLSNNDSVFSNDGKGVITVNSIPHEKYSLNENRGFYLEDWLPGFIPEGQRLLYSGTSYHENGDNYTVIHKYVPTTFELTPEITTYDLQTSQGFTIAITRNVNVPMLPSEYYVEYHKGKLAAQDDNVGGYVDMTRDGKFVSAYSGSNKYNHYQATISFHPDEYTLVSVRSTYHTLDELLPIFESVMKENKESIIPTIVMIDQSSDVEFVDDGRELWHAKGGAMSTRDAYQYIIGKWMKHSEFKNDGKGNITLTVVPHEKYSKKPNNTLYLEDWLPGYVPDGYRLLYSQTDWSQKARETTLIHQYVPVSFELTEDTVLWNIQKSKGFTVGVTMTLDKKMSVEDQKIRIGEMDAKFRKNTFKFQDVERDGKEVFAYSGGNTRHSYHATLMFQPDSHTSVTVGSYYHTIDELLPIFYSVMK